MRDGSTVRTAAHSSSGHPSTGPSGVAAQSVARSAAWVGSAPSKMAAAGLGAVHWASKFRIAGSAPDRSPQSRLEIGNTSG